MAEGIPRRQGAGTAGWTQAHAGVHVLSTLGGYARAHRALKRLAVPLAPFPAPSRPSVDRATEYPYDAQPERRRSPSLAASSPATRMPLRLQLDPNRPAEPYLDGAWWPRSTELPVELPALLTALSADLGPIALVGYHRDAWNAARSPRPGRARGAPAGLCLTRSPHGGRHRRQWSTRHGASGATRIRQRNCAQAMMAATHQYAEHDTDARVTKAETVEANSLDEVAARLARLPGNTGPQQAALICGWVGEAAAQFSDAPIQAFVPILVEHIVRGRIHDNRADRPARNR